MPRQMARHGAIECAAFAFRLFTGLFGHQKTGRACALHRNRGLLHLMTPICLVLLKRPSLLKKGCLCIFIPFGRVRVPKGDFFHSCWGAILTVLASFRLMQTALTPKANLIHNKNNNKKGPGCAGPLFIVYQYRF